EPNCPICGFPGANQDTPRAQLPKMPKESPANATPLAARQDVSVTNEIDVTNRLDAHHTCEAAVFLIAPEHDTSGDLAIELLPRHLCQNLAEPPRKRGRPRM